MKNKTIMLILIWLIIFTIICLALTFILINNSLNMSNNNLDVSVSSASSNEDYGIKNLTNKYNANDLKINTIEYTERDLIHNKYCDYYPINLTYLKIDRLKNKDIQNKMNAEIKKTAFNMLNETKLNTDTNIKAICINSYVYANYLNILSILIKSNNNINNLLIGLNYDLNTGNKINFKNVDMYEDVKQEMQRFMEKNIK